MIVKYLIKGRLNRTDLQDRKLLYITVDGRTATEIEMIEDLSDLQKLKVFGRIERFDLRQYNDEYSERQSVCLGHGFTAYPIQKRQK